MSTFCHSINSEARCERLSTMLINQSCSNQWHATHAIALQVGWRLLCKASTYWRFPIVDNSIVLEIAPDSDSSAGFTPIERQYTRPIHNAMWSVDGLTLVYRLPHQPLGRMQLNWPKSTCNRLVGQAKYDS